MTIFWKIAHSLYKVCGGVLTPLPRMSEFLNYWICANAVSAKAEIGSGTKFWHRGLGCTVHYKAKIGENCKILPNVMIGAKFKNGLPDEDVPIIGGNAVIVGKIKIGNNEIVATNSVVTKDVPDDCYALGTPAEIKKIRNT